MKREQEVLAFEATICKYEAVPFRPFEQQDLVSNKSRAHNKMLTDFAGR